MDRLRKSFRDSFRRKKAEHIPESSKPHQWQADEHAVRAGNCIFPVKYLGCVEVFESRGMQVCEEALKVLRSTSRRRPLKSILYVTGDGLRVVDEETKGLVVDQTIEKVSFCAPDRNHERGFSYICRDGTTRRWMCHGFYAGKDSGERLSHAVGCAFAVCLERKQKRDKETVSMNFDSKTSTFTRTGSFRQTSITDRLQDPQDCKPTEPPPVKAVHNPYAIARPHATPQLLQRQGSFRVFSDLNQSSPFKRQLSLRVNELPSNMERQRAHSLESSDLYSRPNGTTVEPIPEVSPVAESKAIPDTISEMCKELSQGLSILTNTEDPLFSPIAAYSGQSVLAANHVHPVKQTSVASTQGWHKGGICSEAANLQTLVSELSSGSPSTSSASSASPSIPSTTSIPVAPPRKSSPNFSHLRSQSLGQAEAFTINWQHTSQQARQQTQQPAGIWTNGSAYPGKDSISRTEARRDDPFDAEWAALATRHEPDLAISTNPFAQTSTIKAFEVQM